MGLHGLLQGEPYLYLAPRESRNKIPDITCVAVDSLRGDVRNLYSPQKYSEVFCAHFEHKNRNINVSCMFLKYLSKTPSRPYTDLKSATCSVCTPPKDRQPYV
jgi:hypothetical protein